MYKSHSYLWIFAKFTGNVSNNAIIQQQYFQIQQWLKNMTNMEIVLIANIRPRIRNMNVEQVRLKDSL